ncbi:MAG: DUF423 domain-containing protein [Verrucomicrobiales bacterium]|jgi:uncharacterized membrane protein YgdD (TMEM256/DUF423 family)|nr:DUF423 domain-containing protein [Verrucomicrobiales bacterium]
MIGRVDGYFRVAALFGLLAVALGAFGAHALKDSLTASGMTEVWKTAVLYHLVHAAVLLFVSWSDLSRKAWWCFVIGVLLFSGSLYLLAVSGIKPLGIITPFGGISLLAGWLLLIVAPRR